MSFLPSPNSVVELDDGRTGTVDRLTDDRQAVLVIIEKVAWSDRERRFVTRSVEMVRVEVDEIAKVIWEPEDEPE